MPDLVSISNELKSLPDQALQSELANPTGAVPSYLVLAEAQRRATLRSGAAQGSAEQPSSVYADVMRNLMARQPAPGPPAPPGATPPPGGPPPSGLGALAGSAPPPSNFKTPAALGMAEGGSVDDADSEDNYVPPPTGSADRHAPDIDSFIQNSADKYGMDPDLVRSVIQLESGGRSGAVSPKGAAGLMQLEPGTAKDMGVTDPTDPAQNIDGGTKYLRMLYDRYGGDRKLMLAGYNAGPGAVEHYGGVPPFRQTRKYIKDVEGTLAQLKASQQSAARATPSADADADATDTSSAGSADTAAPAEKMGPPEVMGPPEAPATGIASALDQTPSAGGPEAGAQDGGPEEPMFDPSRLPINAPPPAPGATTMAVAAPTPAAPAPAAPAPAPFNPAAVSPNFQIPDNLKNELARLHTMAEKNAKPNFWKMLQDFGFGMAASPAHSLGTQIGAGGMAMAKAEEERQKENQQLQLGLLGVDASLDNQVRAAQTKIAEAQQKAIDQAAKRSQDEFDKLSGAGVMRGNADQAPGTGWKFVANPAGGIGKWVSPTTGVVTAEKVPFLKGFVNPDTGKPYQEGQTLPATIDSQVQQKMLAATQKEIEEKSKPSKGLPGLEGFGLQAYAAQLNKTPDQLTPDEQQKFLPWWAINKQDPQTRQQLEAARDAALADRKAKEAATGPAVVQNEADIVAANPEAYFDLKPELKPLVRQELVQRGARIPVQKPNKTLQDQAASSTLALSHVANVESMLNDPFIQQHVLGPIEGRIAKGEEVAGFNVPGATPAQNRLTQNFLTSLNYLFFREGRPLFGGRPPEKLMEELKKTSPGVQMAPDRFRGAMDAVKQSANMAINANREWMYSGGVPGVAAPARPAAPGPAAGATSRTITLSDGRRAFAKGNAWYYVDNPTQKVP